MRTITLNPKWQGEHFDCPAYDSDHGQAGKDVLQSLPHHSQHHPAILAKSRPEPDSSERWRDSQRATARFFACAKEADGYDKGVQTTLGLDTVLNMPGDPQELMHTTLWRQLQTSVQALLTTPDYYPCLLIVHEEIARLQAAAEALREHVAWPEVGVGAELSAALLPVEPRSRPRQAARWVEKRLAQAEPGPVLCTDIDLLFEPSLQLDPLVLLRSASRRTRLAVLWPGRYEHGILSYAVPVHTHYRTWADPQVLIAGLT